MIKKIHEDITINVAGLEEILKLRVEQNENIDRTTTRVRFDVTMKTEGQGYAEHDSEIFKRAVVETTTPTRNEDVLQILGRRSFIFNEEETKQAIADYVVHARTVNPSQVSVNLKLEGRHQGDRGGWEGPSLTGAVVTIEIL